MKPLTPQQEKFAQLVAEGNNQSAACALTGVSLYDKPIGGGYYVYLLIDPRDNAIFYVGKGKGSRMAMHGKSAHIAREQGHPKNKRILEIREAGMDVQPRVFAMFDDERDALALERHLIAQWRSRLTNISQGSAKRDEVCEFLAHVWKIVLSIKPFDDWIAGARDDQLALASKHPGGPGGLYDQHIDELTRIIHLQIANFRSRGLSC